jgi:glycogen phosphorylase
VNGVSVLHGGVTREMWGPIWPDVAPDDRPVQSITNGVHLPTWIAADLKKLFDKYLPGWREHADDPAVWKPLLDIPDKELWDVRTTLRAFLFNFIRERMRLRWTEERVSPPRVVAGGTLLDPHALTIGFARRFTGYKRPELIFHDAARLQALLNDERRPLQIVFAGKAHPADESGKHALQGVYRRALDPAFNGRIAFVDDYDLHVAHYFVQGCDVWMNNPRKPLEASGTSGMKASSNGVPHLSIGDGWWAEGFTGENGWLIDPGVEYADLAQQDAADADALYTLIEQDIVPAFYDRDDDDVPHRWVARVKQAIVSVAPTFSTRRMVKEYVQRMYLPSMRQAESK